MLVLARYVNERIMIGDDIVITITDVNPLSGKVKVGIEAPNDIRVDREEVRLAINKNKNGVQNV
jgi:carbon storage regulator